MQLAFMGMETTVRDWIKVIVIGAEKNVELRALLLRLRCGSCAVCCERMVSGLISAATGWDMHRRSSSVGAGMKEGAAGMSRRRTIHGEGPSMRKMK